MQGFVLPTGRRTALIGEEGRFSFDDVNALVLGLQTRMAARFTTPPKRILGCLEDSLGSLLALLACPEVSDYMPVNPKLLDEDILAMAERGGVDAAILSKSSVKTIGAALSARGLDVIEWDAVVSDAMGADVTVPKAAEGFWQDRPGRLILHTSGTTGSPKRVPITIDAMMQSAHTIAKHHELKSDDLALNTLPTFHIGAVVDVLLAPFYGGGAVALTSDRSTDGMASAIREIRPTWVQLVPTLLLRLTEGLNEAELKDLGTSLRFIRSISAPIPEALRKRAEDSLGCPAIEMYGMTETAGQITTNSRGSEGRREGTVGRKTTVDIKILDATGSAVREHQPGEICVKGPTVFDGYEDVPRGEVFHGDWFRTGDLGSFDKDGFLSIRGRIKEMINIGGEKVSPSEIETVALQHPDVIEAAAYSLAHDTLGEVSGLTIAVRKTLASDVLQDFIGLKLPDFKRPRRIRQVEALPRLPNEKVDRLKTKRDAANEAKADAKEASAVHYVDGSVEKIVADQWIRALKSRVPEGDDDFFDMGGDSLSAVEFLLNLSTALQHTLPTNQLFATPTFDGMVAAAAQKHPVSTSMRHRAIDFVVEKMAGWPGQEVLEDGLFRGFGTVQNGQALFWSCQNVEEVELIRRSFAARRPLYVVRSLFKLSGKSIFRRKKRSEVDFEALTNALVEEINQIQPHGEICIGGFCGGGMVMERVAQALIEGGRTIRVFVSIDYWPEAPIHAPVVHGMTRCTRHSARVVLEDFENPLYALHPSGVEVLEIDAPHVFLPQDFLAQSTRIEAALDGISIPTIDAAMKVGWSFDDRTSPPSVNILKHRLPRFYGEGDRLPFQIEMKNSSDKVLDPFEQSGLSFEVNLYNLDGVPRYGFSGFAPLLNTVKPNGAAKLHGEIDFPDKKVPIVLRGEFKSHGVARANSHQGKVVSRIIWPRLTAR